MRKKLLLMEPARFPEYSGSIGFLFGENSFLNPHRRFGGTEEILRSCGSNSSIRIISGGHGEFFQPPNIEVPAEAIREDLEKAPG